MTWNPWIGCTKVSPGCAHCYAETLMDTRYGKVKWGKGQPRQRTSAANWKLPMRWNRQAGVDELCAASLMNDPKISEASRQWLQAYHRPRVFCASLADWLDDEVPVEWLADLLALIRATPNLDWLLLTKRPGNWRSRVSAALGHMRAALRGEVKDQNGMTIDPYWEDLRQWVASWIGGTPPANVWIGTSVEDQERADERIPELLRISAKVRFLSCEPLLGEVSIHTPEPLRPTYNVLSKMGGIDWLICGGESGPHARPMRPDWARSLRDQCKAADVPFFMKQMGGTRKPFAPIPDDLNIRQFPTL